FYRKPAEPALTDMRDDGTEQLLLAAEVSINSGLRGAGFARDRVHRDCTEAARQKRALGGGKDRLGLARSLLASGVALQHAHRGTLALQRGGRIPAGADFSGKVD